MSQLFLKRFSRKDVMTQPPDIKPSNQRYLKFISREYNNFSMEHILDMEVVLTCLKT
jgi:hypothetical protein